MVDFSQPISYLLGVCFFCRVYENGKETIMSYEDDVLMSKTVNGVPQSITYSY